jgi:hypothetical protein
LNIFGKYIKIIIGDTMEEITYIVQDILTNSRTKSSKEFIKYLEEKLNFHFNIQLDDMQSEDIRRIALNRFGSANIRYFEKTKNEKDSEKIINATNNLAIHTHQDVETGIENDVMLELYFQHKEVFKDNEKAIRTVVKEAVEFKITPNIYELVCELKKIIEPLFIKEENKEGLNFEGVLGSTNKEVKKERPSLEETFGPIDNNGLNTEGVFIEIDSLNKLKEKIIGKNIEGISTEGVFVR